MTKQDLKIGVKYNIISLGSERDKRFHFENVEFKGFFGPDENLLSEHAVFSFSFDKDDLNIMVGFLKDLVVTEL